MKNRFPNRRWCIINSGDAANVNFNQVMENSVETLRYSVDKSKTFVKYNVSTHPIPKGTNDQGDIIYGDNVDSQGRTYTLHYETVEQVVDFYSDQPGQGHIVTGSGIVNFPTENVTGSGILYESGVTVGRPDIFSSALTVSGKTEFNHSEILGILATEEWSSTGIF